MDISLYRRYPGTRWKLLYGSYEGIEKVAVNELQRTLQAYLPYVIETRQESGECCKAPDEDNLILVGTPSSNRILSLLVSKGVVQIPAKQEGYTLACMNAPCSDVKRLLIIAGNDPKGLLNGVHAFGAQVFNKKPAELPDDKRAVIDNLADFTISDYPLIENRGIWTWGYVIYDYKRFIDNMAKLRMNILVIWNDCPPINATDVIAYAHAHGIKVVLGFHWGWGIADLDPNNPEHRAQIKEVVVNNYTENYRHLGIDGIYFQTFTEHTELDMGGRSTASLACEWVNDISRTLLEIEPNLLIQFGLHASSIRENYADLKELDPRVVIMWEDAGVLPYTYIPALEFDATHFENPAYPAYRDIEDQYEYTLKLSKQYATFRPGTEFAIVPKGYIHLRWENEWENHTSFILGERNPQFIHRRLEERQSKWDVINSLWLKLYPYAIRFYSEILDCNPKITAAALVEDGLFEERIQSSVAIYAETIWNPKRKPEEILQQAMSPYYLGF